MANGGPVIQGTLNQAQSSTHLANDGTVGTDGTGLYVHAAPQGGDALYSVGYTGSGVNAFSHRGDGVYGTAVSGGLSGVHGAAYAVAGVYGEDRRGGVGVAGHSARGLGTSGSGAGVGVYGEASDVNGFGVEGINRNGRESGVGVYGFARTGVWGNGTLGVVGRSAADFGIGVEGDSVGEGGVGVFGATTANFGGVGVYATAPNAGSSALEVQGRARFSTSGRLVVQSGAVSATATGVSLSAASLVLATIQEDRPGVAVRAAVPDVAASLFTVHLTQAPAADTVVAWFVIN